MSLHNEIMNIECKKHHGINYRLGHKDARHAAAELALNLNPQQKPLSDEEIEKISNLIDEEANSDNGFEEWANMFARHIEKAHGIT
jgi:ribosomal protein S13